MLYKEISDVEQLIEKLSELVLSQKVRAKSPAPNYRDPQFGITPSGYVIPDALFLPEMQYKDLDQVYNLLPDGEFKAWMHYYMPMLMILDGIYQDLPEDEMFTHTWNREVGLAHVIYSLVTGR